MNRLIQFKTTRPLLITLALLCFGLLPRERAAHVGDTVFGFVGVEIGFPFPFQLTLRSLFTSFWTTGVWLVSGQFNFLSLNTPAGTMFTAGNIAMGSLSF